MPCIQHCNKEETVVHSREVSVLRFGLESNAVQDGESVLNDIVCNLANLVAPSNTAYNYGIDGHVTNFVALKYDAHMVEINVSISSRDVSARYRCGTDPK